ncbi:hypothetical protein B0H63DRAFT_459623 [Podospora didyma]|uniref:Uncharacterized protein n=1 Tax=Podospora didyma TaxID=330526 RepID=A0AAE0P5Z8_9PEZI|nr:hypothetical protein B0H63DRAFT_459623 [Podospora didyma]
MSTNPMNRKGHQPGHNQHSSDAPEFHAQTLPAGTAPKEHLFRPPHAQNPEIDPSFHPGPVDFPGATSKDVYADSAFGRPMEGQTGREIFHAGGTDGKKIRSGLEGRGSSGDSRETVEAKARATRTDIPEEIGPGIRGQKTAGATERIPVSASELASERAFK